MKNAQSLRPPVEPAGKVPDPPDYVPAKRPDDQDGFDEGMKISARSVREILERRRKKR